MAGPHTLYVAPGTYGRLTISAANWNNGTVIGTSAVGSITNAVMGQVILTGTGGNVFSPASSGLTIKNLTITGSDSIYDLAVVSGANFTGVNLYLYGSGRYTFYLSGATGFNISNSRIIGNSFQTPINVNSGSSGTFSNNRIEGNLDLNSGQGGISQSTIGTVNYNNNLITNISGTSVSITAGIANFNNNIINSSLNQNPFTVVRTGGTVNLINNYIGADWGALHRTISGTAGTDIGNIYGGNIEFKSQRTSGFIVPSVDDSANLSYAKLLETELASRGLKGTFAVQGADFASNTAELQAMNDRGTMEIGVHSYSHSILTATTAFSVLKLGQTIDINRDTDTITVSGVSPLTPFKNKTLDQIRTWFTTTAGCTLGSLGNLFGNSLGEDLDNVTAQSINTPYNLPLLLDATGATGFYHVEIVEAKEVAEANLTGYTAKTFLTPWGQSNATVKSIALAAGYTSVRNSLGSINSSWDLNNLDLGNLGFIDQTWWSSTDSVAASVAAHSIAQGMSQKGGIVFPLAHNVGQATISQWQTFLDVIEQYPTVTVTSSADVVNTIRTSGLWSTTDNINYTRTMPDQSDYELQSSSPAIDAGTSVGLTNDYAGNPIYGAPDIGAYEYQPPLTIGNDEVNIGVGGRIYQDGQFRDLGTNSGGGANLSVSPTGGFTVYGATETRPAWLDITNITNWTTTQKTWTEENAIAGLTNTVHAVGDLEADKFYNVSVDGLGTDISGTDCDAGICQADGSGVVNFTYGGTYPAAGAFDVVLNSTVPTGTVTIQEVITKDAVIELILGANDNISGIASMQFSNNGTDWSGWESYAGTKSWNLETGAGGTDAQGNRTVYAQYKNNNGIESVISSATVIYDVPPTFGNLPGTTEQVDPSEGQLITTNPYIIQVKPESVAGIEKVEFLVDDALICTETTAVSGVYSCSWDTARYQGSIRIIAYDIYGATTTITREVTVDPSLYTTTLPQTGKL